MAESTIEEAREIYKKSDDLKDLMLTKFSKSEIKGVTQEEFDKIFLELLGQCSKTAFLNEVGDESQLPNNRIELRNSDNEWMFDIQFTGKNKHFWGSDNRVWNILHNTYSFQYEDSRRFVKNQMIIRFGLSDVSPQ